MNKEHKYWLRNFVLAIIGISCLTVLLLTVGHQQANYDKAQVQQLHDAYRKGQQERLLRPDNIPTCVPDAINGFSCP